MYTQKHLHRTRQKDTERASRGKCKDAAGPTKAAFLSPARKQGHVEKNGRTPSRMQGCLAKAASLHSVPYTRASLWTLRQPERGLARVGGAVQALGARVGSGPCSDRIIAGARPMCSAQTASSGAPLRPHHETKQTCSFTLPKNREPRDNHGARFRGPVLGARGFRTSKEHRGAKGRAHHKDE